MGVAPLGLFQGGGFFLRTFCCGSPSPEHHPSRSCYQRQPPFTIACRVSSCSMLQFKTFILIANVGLFWILEETNLGL